MSIIVKQRLTGAIPTTEVLIGEIRYGCPTKEDCVTPSDIPDGGAFVQYENGEWDIQALQNAEDMKY